MWAQRLTRRGLLLGAAALGAAAAPGRLLAARSRAIIEGLEVESDGAAPFGGDRSLLVTLSPAGIRGRARAIVRFRLTRAAHVELVALDRNAPGGLSLASETTPAGPRSPPGHGSSARERMSWNGIRALRLLPGRTRCRSRPPTSSARRRCTALRRPRTRICSGRPSSACSGSMLRWHNEAMPPATRQPSSSQRTHRG